MIAEGLSPTDVTLQLRGTKIDLLAGVSELRIPTDLREWYPGKRESVGYGLYRVLLHEA
uniref:Uncharacterized protein n=1 Tax=Hyaloperonospora arabidopsidis (strain Emoy2) TaxID=559515 RepID=M4BSW6_HYAAE